MRPAAVIFFPSGKMEGRVFTLPATVAFPMLWFRRLLSHATPSPLRAINHSLGVGTIKNKRQLCSRAPGYRRIDPLALALLTHLLPNLLEKENLEF